MCSVVKVSERESWYRFVVCKGILRVSGAIFLSESVCGYVQGSRLCRFVPMQKQVQQRPFKAPASTLSELSSAPALSMIEGQMALRLSKQQEMSGSLIRMTIGAIGSPDIAVARGFVMHEGIVGHMGVGLVQTLEAGVQADAGLAIGQRVAVWPHLVCTKCEFCKAGLSTHCPARTVMGLRKAPGLFSPLASIPTRNLVALPSSLDDDRASLATLVASALATVGLVRVEGKPFVTVLGDGPVGLLVAQLLARRNASVRLIGTHPQRLATCEKWGVKHRHTSDVGTHRDQHMVFDCTGSPLGTRLAMQLVRPRGTIVIKSWPLPVSASAVKHERLNLSFALSGEATIIGSGPGTLAHMHEAIDALAQRSIDVEPLISRRFALSNFDAAYTQAAMPDAACMLLDLQG